MWSEIIGKKKKIGKKKILEAAATQTYSQCEVTKT